MDHSGRRSRWLVVAAAVVPALVYLAFIHTYAVNALFWDDWNMVPLLSGFSHGTVTFGQLWALHIDNRMLVPNVVQGGTLLFGHYDARRVMFVSALVFIATWALVLLTVRRCSGRLPGIVAILLLGGIWFSLIDTQNALWAFQLAWYLILFLLVALAALFSGPSIRPWQLGLGVLLAVLASFSSLQGLLAWPLGLLVIGWRVRDRRTFLPMAGVWLVAGIATFACYFAGFSESNAGGSSKVGLEHPILVAKFVVLALGNVLPNAGTPQLARIELTGLILAAGALFVIVRSVMKVRQSTALPFPLYLVLFGLLFDVVAGIGRVSLGTSSALVNHYTMANLVIVVGIGLFAWEELALAPGATQAILRGQPGWRVVLGGAVCAVALVQIGVGTSYGINAAQLDRANKITGNRVVVSYHDIAPEQRDHLVHTYVFGAPSSFPPFRAQARRNEIAVFAEPFYSRTLRLGPPRRSP